MSSLPPQQFQSGSPPGRPHRPAAPLWLWLVGGCAVVSLLVVVVSVLLMAAFATRVNSTVQEASALTADTVADEIGADMVYPDSSFDAEESRGMNEGAAVSRMIGEVIPGVSEYADTGIGGIYTTADGMTDVTDWYDEQFSVGEWRVITRYDDQEMNYRLARQEGRGLMIWVEPGEEGGAKITVLRAAEVAATETKPLRPWGVESRPRLSEGNDP